MSSTWLIVLLVVVWLFVLAPILINTREPIRRTSRALDETRVLHRGDEGQLTPRRRRPAVRADERAENLRDVDAPGQDAEFVDSTLDETEHDDAVVEDVEIANDAAAAEGDLLSEDTGPVAESTRTGERATLVSRLREWRPLSRRRGDAEDTDASVGVAPQTPREDTDIVDAELTGELVDEPAAPASASAGALGTAETLAASEDTEATAPVDVEKSYRDVGEDSDGGIDEEIDEETDLVDIVEDEATDEDSDEAAADETMDETAAFEEAEYEGSVDEAEQVDAARDDAEPAAGLDFFEPEDQFVGEDEFSADQASVDRAVLAEADEERAFARQDATTELDDADYEFAARRRGRGGYDPVADRASTEARYARRRRTVYSLLAITTVSLVVALVFGGAAWWAPAVAVLLTAGYLTALRGQVRLENELRARRIERMKRARLGVESRQDRELKVTPTRLRRPGATVLETDDGDPIFDHLRRGALADGDTYRDDDEFDDLVDYREESREDHLHDRYGRLRAQASRYPAGPGVDIDAVRHIEWDDRRRHVS